MRTLKPGTVVEFTVEADTWVGSFPIRPHRAQLAELHPNGRDVMVIATGDLWVINPVQRSAERLLPAIEAALQVRDADRWIFNRQGIALARPFRVDLSTGESTGGSYFDEDTEGWEWLAE